MKKFCDIDIMSRSNSGNGGGTFVKDIPLEDAAKKCKEIESIMRDFVIANECNVVFNDVDEYGSFVAVDLLDLRCVYVTVNNIRESNGPETLREKVEGMMQRVLEIDHPAGLLEKIQDQEIEHVMEDEEWAYGHNQVSDYRHLTKKEYDDNMQWESDMAEAMQKDSEKHPERYKGGAIKW